jgi:hypothetical protein
VHALGIKALVIGHVEQRLDNIRSDLRSPRFPGNPEAISTAGYFNVEAAFNLAQVFVKLTAEVGEPTVVGGFQDDVLRYLCGVQFLVLTPVARRKLRSNKDYNGELRLYRQMMT